jgi:hypothetical protein
MENLQPKKERERNRAKRVRSYVIRIKTVKINGELQHCLIGGSVNQMMMGMTVRI